MKQVINRVAITGADDSIRPDDLRPLTERFPFVEWAILLSANSEGGNRFPSLAWMEQLPDDLPLAGHLCGRWVRDICKGHWSFLDERPTIASKFRRFQLNFHAYVHKIIPNDFIKGFSHPILHGRQFIFQLDDVNNSLLDVARNAGIDAVPLFDTSGGIGRLPDAWPAAHKGYCGYAGGLSPDNLSEQIPKIIAAAGGSESIWIDVETHVRSQDDRQFDLQKVERFLSIAESYVI